MLLVHAEKLKKSYGTRVILDTGTLSLYEGDRIGLVGQNGAGKTTLLSILAGADAADAGSINRIGTIAYVPQLKESEVALKGEFASKWHVPEQKQMSGGERTRKKIAAALGSSATIFIADEPTSHLDIQGIKQLEHEISCFDGAVLLTSHDKSFLNGLCTVIWEIEDGVITVYEGNYDAYLDQKKEKQETEKKQYEEYVREKKRLKQAAKSLQAKSDAIKKAPSRMGNSEARLHKRRSGKQKAKLNRAAEAMVTRANKLDHKHKPQETTPIKFDIAAFPALYSKRIFQMNRFPVRIGDYVLKEGVHGEVLNGSRVAITGKNGTGKSTFLKSILEKEESLKVAKPVKMGFFKQQQENLNENKTILENVQEGSPYHQTFVRVVLSRLAFKRDDVHKRVSLLSGGERVRTTLAKVFLGNYNVLILDEPTNYLDLETKSSLIEVLKAYPGTVVFVTHDRSLVEALATHRLSFDENEPTLKAVSVPDLKEEDDQKDTLLAIDLKLSETLSRLSTVENETEKKELDQLFAKLLLQKKQLKQ